MGKRRLIEDLTAREREVFELLRRGLTNEEIAGHLSISVGGAKYHVSQILSKLGVVTREEAAAWRPEERGWYWKLGWLTGASLMIAAPIGLAALLLDGDGTVDLESEVVADDGVVTGGRRSTPAAPASTGPTSSNPTSADTGRPGRSVASTPTPRPASTAETLSPVENGSFASLPTPATTFGPAGGRPATPAPATDAPGVPARSGKIAFESGDHIDVMAYDGSGRTSITRSTTEFDAQPAWSPDGARIAFSRSTLRYSGSSDIHVANADGSGVTRLTNLSGNEIDPTWSPDGSRVAFVNDFSLWVMNADGSNMTMIFGSPEVGVRAPSWSPAGSRIAFHGYFHDQNTGRTSADIFAVNEDGSQLTRLTNDPAYDGFAAWSPDGARIAFTRAPLITSAADWEIYLMNADGSNQVRLAVNGIEASWSPDGATIAFTRKTTNLDIYSIAVDGTNEVNLTNSPSDESAPHWHPVRG